MAIAFFSLARDGVGLLDEKGINVAQATNFFPLAGAGVGPAVCVLLVPLLLHQERKGCCGWGAGNGLGGNA